MGLMPSVTRWTMMVNVRAELHSQGTSKDIGTWTHSCGTDILLKDTREPAGCIQQRPRGYQEDGHVPARRGHWQTGLPCSSILSCRLQSCGKINQGFGRLVYHVLCGASVNTGTRRDC